MSKLAKSIPSMVAVVKRLGLLYSDLPNLHRNSGRTSLDLGGRPGKAKRGVRTKRSGMRVTYLFTWVYRGNPATVYILMHNFRPDWTG